MGEYRGPASYDFANALYTHRRAAGYTQAELASRIDGIDAETVSRYERGVREPRIRRLIAIAEALEISPAQLLPRPHGETQASTWQDAVYVALTQQGDFTPNEAAAMVDILEATAKNLPALRSF